MKRKEKGNAEESSKARFKLSKLENLSRATSQSEIAIFEDDERSETRNANAPRGIATIERRVGRLMPKPR